MVPDQSISFFTGQNFIQLSNFSSPFLLSTPSLAGTDLADLAAANLKQDTALIKTSLEEIQGFFKMYSRAVLVIFFLL